jgi:hypothetical protein
MRDKATMRAPSIWILVVTALFAACGGGNSHSDGGTSGGTSGGLDGGPTSGNPLGLWASGVFAYSTAELASSGSPAPTDQCLDPSNGAASAPAAFDTSGNLWVQSSADSTMSVVMRSNAELAAACSTGAPTITVTISYPGVGMAEIDGMAFDPAGNLWLSMSTVATILGLSKSQLAATGTVQPTYLIQLDDTGDARELWAPLGLAFDSSGNLWVANNYSILEYSAASVAAATGAPSSSAAAVPPTAFLSTAASEAVAEQLSSSGPTTPYPTFQYLAFDSSGNLWVSGEGNGSQSPGEYIAEYSTAQLAAAATNATPTPAVTITESADQLAAAGTLFGALAFDGAGNLWLGSSANLYRYPATTLSQGGSYDIALTNLEYLTFHSLAFNPIPSGLPLW